MRTEGRLFFHCAVGVAVYIHSPLLYECLEVVWPLAGEVHLLTSYWMNEAESLGMKCLTRTNLKAVVDELHVFRSPLSLQRHIAAITLITNLAFQPETLTDSVG